ncbi:MAG: 3'(2'),5'-bisphosphate nucleotidase CysQ [Pseudohongiellaceae bacterium]
MNSTLTKLMEISVAAGEAILEVYHEATMEVSHKADDSPVTEADQRAHELIIAALAELTPDIPVLSEESAPIPYTTRKQWQQYWLVDPLDGTKEFIKRNDEFTVNIALIANGKPVCGVVHVPVSGVTYVGAIARATAGTISKTTAAWKCTPGNKPQPIQAVAMQDKTPLRIAASRTHTTPHLRTVLDHIKAALGKEAELVCIGSSLKICLLAEGKVDFYPRLTPTSEWDTAAAHAVLLAAGGQITDISFNPLTYNQKDNLLNPHFLALADPTYNWQRLLDGCLDGT